MYFIRGCCRYQYRQSSPPSSLFASSTFTLFTIDPYLTLHALVPFFFFSFPPLFCSSVPPPSSRPNGLFNLNKFKKSGQPREYQISVARRFALLSLLLRHICLENTSSRLAVSPCHRRAVPFFPSLRLSCLSSLLLSLSLLSRAVELPTSSFPLFSSKIIPRIMRETSRRRVSFRVDPRASRENQETGKQRDSRDENNVKPIHSRRRQLSSTFSKG